MRPDDFSPGGSKLDYLGFWVVLAALVAATWIFFRRTRGAARPSPGRSRNAPRHGAGAGRLVAGNLLVFLSLLWSAVVAAETYLRWFYDQTDQYGLMMTNADWFFRHVNLNSRQYRDREWKEEKPAGVQRVACVGDSFTMGWGVKNLDDVWPRRVGAGLEAAFPGRFEVRLYADPGLATGQETEMIARYARPDRWDRVVLGYCLNDPDDLLPREHVFDRSDAQRVPTADRSFLADFLWYRLHHRGDERVRGYFDWEKEAYDDPKIWGAQCQRFAAMAEACRALSVRLDVVVFPFFHDWGPAYRFDSCHDRVIEAWKRLGVDVIDLREAYRGIPGPDLVVNRFDAHPNEKAHAIAARVVLERAFGAR